VDMFLFFTRRGAPDTADCPPQYAVAAECTPLYLANAGQRAESIETTPFGGRKVRIAQGQSMNFGIMWVVAGSPFVLN